MKKICCIVGARPQIIKHAPVYRALSQYFEVVTVHTGQHYDAMMSQVFFDELDIPAPKYDFKVGSNTHGHQTANIMIALEKLLIQSRFDAVLVYGDTNSTLAGALVASKLNIPVIHIEAGLRSYNREMPEEINRIVTDHLSTYLFCSTDEARKLLTNEGIDNQVHVVGDVMVDTLLYVTSKLSDVASYKYHLVTLHRPYNVDDPVRLKYILDQLNSLATKIIFPVHPRTNKLIAEIGLDAENYKNIEFLPPQSYLDLIQLQKNAEAIITDSGGIQKEAYLLKKRCVTVRPETEWIETLSGHWNTLLFHDLSQMEEVLTRPLLEHHPHIFGDGRAAIRIANILKQIIYNEK